MYNIALYAPILLDNSSLALKKYVSFCNDSRICNQPLIFCDVCNLVFEPSIPIFSSIYIKQKFIEYYIITDVDNVDLLGSDAEKIIAVCGEDNSKSIYPDNVYTMNHNDDIMDLIKRISQS